MSGTTNKTISRNKVKTLNPNSEGQDSLHLYFPKKTNRNYFFKINRNNVSIKFSKI